MREIHRIKNKRYTDSDVISFYMKYREKNIGPFIREVGDFIAHENRNQGVTLETTVFVFSQLAFFQKYQSNKKEDINPFGPCYWWLRPYFLGKIEEARPKDVMREAGLTLKQAKLEIKSWFPEKDPYPTQIKCKNIAAFWGLTQLFSRYIKGQSVFAPEKVKKELEAAFRKEGIHYEEIPSFLIATAIVLAGKSCSIVSGFNAHIKISIDQPRYVELNDIPVPKGATWKYVRILPDGNLKVSVFTENKTGDGLVDTILDLFNTGVDTENYIDRALLKIDEHGRVMLDLDRHLAFERASKPMVFPID